jgi:ABC-type glycerol-3-phosphate transport system substrate-binding protein
MLILFFSLFAIQFSDLSYAVPSATPIRFLLPHWPFSNQFESELSAAVKKFNDEHADSPVQLMWRGEDFSTTKDLMAQHLSGSTPELAAIEYTEFPAIESAKLAQPIPEFKPLGLKNVYSIPFERTAPYLFINQERLFRVHMEKNNFPTTWEEFLNLVHKLKDEAKTSKDRFALALPLQGVRGLWILEALSQKPLWQREAGGIKTNSALESNIDVLQKVIDQPNLARTEETWEKAVQAFIDRKASVLVGSVDLIPYVTQEAKFRWIAGPAPGMQQGTSLLEGGSHLIVIKDKPHVREFIAYLYSEPVMKKWIEAGGFLPLKSSAKSKLQMKGKLRARSTDSDVIRTRSNWIQALHLLFGDASRRTPTKSVLTQLDSQLTLR